MSNYLEILLTRIFGQYLSIAPDQTHGFPAQTYIFSQWAPHNHLFFSQRFQFDSWNFFLLASPVAMNSWKLAPFSPFFFFFLLPLSYWQLLVAREFTVASKLIWDFELSFLPSCLLVSTCHSSAQIPSRRGQDNGQEHTAYVETVWVWSQITQ